jgi:hypothetical protein
VWHAVWRTKWQFSLDEHDQRPQSARCDAGFVETPQQRPRNISKCDDNTHQLVLAKDDIGMGRAAVPSGCPLKNFPLWVWAWRRGAR